MKPLTKDDWKVIGIFILIMIVLTIGELLSRNLYLIP